MAEAAREQFVSEPIEPVAGTFDASAMALGEPGLPGRFVWRGGEHVVAEVVERWKESGPCSHGSGELYLRKHWYRIRTTEGREMTLYFERQPGRRGGKAAARWWLYTIDAAASAEQVQRAG